MIAPLLPWAVIPAVDYRPGQGRGLRRCTRKERGSDVAHTPVDPGALIVKLLAPHRQIQPTESAPGGPVPRRMPILTTSYS